VPEQPDRTTPRHATVWTRRCSARFDRAPSALGVRADASTTDESAFRAAVQMIENAAEPEIGPIILVHTPIPANWLNQVEIDFSIIQRKVLTPNHFATLQAIRLRLALYEELSNRTPRPFAWEFARQDMVAWLKRVAPHFSAASAV
jgi:hypothetical protein